MTSLGDDNNPYGRASPWPKMPQGAFLVGGPMGAAVRRPGPAPAPAQTVAPEPEPEPAPEPRPSPERALETVASIDIAPQPEPVATPESMAIPPVPERELAAAPVFAPIARRRAPATRNLRLTPLIAAAAVGAGGMLALVLVMGVGRPTPVAQPATAAATPVTPAPQTLAADTPASPSPAAPAPAQPPAPVAKTQAPRLTLAARTAQPAAPKPAAAPASPPPMLAIRGPAATPEPAQSFSTQIALPAARPIASLAGPAEPPLAPPPSAPAYTPKPAPDPNAPIPTHTPDAN